MKLRISTPVLAVLLLATAFHSMGPAASNAPQEVKIVTISLDTAADPPISVSEDPVVVSRGQTVEWTADPASNIQSWTILFQSPDPFGNSAAMEGFRGQGTERRGAALSTAVEAGARFKYMVRVSTGQRVYVLDPEVEVGPGE